MGLQLHLKLAHRRVHFTIISVTTQSCLPAPPLSRSCMLCHPAPPFSRSCMQPRVIQPHPFPNYACSHVSLPAHQIHFPPYIIDIIRNVYYNYLCLYRPCLMNSLNLVCVEQTGFSPPACTTQHPHHSVHQTNDKQVSATSTLIGRFNRTNRLF